METRRKEIIQCAASLFHQYGIKSVSMEDIARELGMSKRTLYQFVKDKIDVVESVLQYNIELFTQLLEVFHNDGFSAIEQFHKYTKGIDAHFPKINPSMHYDLRKFYPALLAKADKKVQGLIHTANVANLEKGKKEGFYRSDIDSDVISNLQIVIQNYLFDPSNDMIKGPDIVDRYLINQIYKYHFRGICTPKGIEELKRFFE
ncbi:MULTISPECIES: TetR/AcrR family transcriptional regulator [unclassified Carboxylicivirga]|uniref:TetR/AcrR family transcriptional regulator n=1 Tax=Carboxylicivirga TaxID=1628153 RepID=UPI003D32E733